MWGTWLNNSTLPALEQTAAFSQKRHMLLAGNIANLDVPGYRTRDISLDDFQQALRTAVEQQASQSSGYRSPGGFQSSEAMSPGSMFSEAVSPEAMERVRDVSKQVIFHDGSDVSLEEQVTEISKNQSLHDMSIALMRSQLQTYETRRRKRPYFIRAAKILSVLFVTGSAVALTYEAMWAAPFTREVPFTVSPANARKLSCSQAGEDCEGFRKVQRVLRAVSRTGRCRCAVQSWCALS